MGVLFNKGGTQYLPGSMSYDAERIVLTGNTDNLAGRHTNTLEFNAQIALNLTGIAGGTDGKRYTLTNPNANTITLKNATTSAAGNQFLFGADVALAQNQTMDIQYVGAAQGWTPVGSTASGGGGTPANPTTSVQFNNAGAFGGSAAYTFNSATNTITLGTVAVPGSLVAPNATGTNAGPSISIVAGNASGVAQQGGNVNITTGNGTGAIGAGTDGIFLVTTRAGILTLGSVFDFFWAGSNGGSDVSGFANNTSAAANSQSAFTCLNNENDSISISVWSSGTVGRPIFTTGPTGKQTTINVVGANVPLVCGVGNKASWVADTNGNFITLAGIARQAYSRQVPVTGFNIVIPNNIPGLILVPAGTLATGTVVTPTTPIDGQEIFVTTSQAITALTVSPSAGQSVVGVPTTLALGGFFRLLYVLADTAWYRVG